MNEFMTKYIQMGTVHFMTYPFVLKLEDQIIPTLKKIIADPYFSVVEVARVRDGEVAKQVKHLFDHTDCVPIYAAQPEQLIYKLDINSFDKTERNKGLEVLKICIDQAYEFGCKGFGYISGKNYPENEQDALKILIESCQVLSEYAASMGEMQMNLEQFDYDFHNRVLIGKTILAKQLAESMVDYQNFGLLVDLSHIPLVYETPKQTLSTLGKYVKHVHVGNAVCSKPTDYLYGDFHPRFSNPNSAVNVDVLTEYIRELFNIGYLGEGKRPMVSFEIKAWDDDDCDAVLAECKRMMDLAWALA